MTSKIFRYFHNETDKPPFMPLYIYNIKKSLSIIYTEENPAQGDSPQQFDDEQSFSRREGKISALASLTNTEGLSVRPLFNFNLKRNKTMKLKNDQITEKREELCKVLAAMNRQCAKADQYPPVERPKPASRRPHTRQSKDQYPPVEGPIPASRRWRRLAGFGAAPGGSQSPFGRVQGDDRRHQEGRQRSNSEGVPAESWRLVLGDFATSRFITLNS